MYSLLLFTEFINFDFSFDLRFIGFYWSLSDSFAMIGLYWFKSEPSSPFRKALVAFFLVCSLSED